MSTIKKFEDLEIWQIAGKFSLKIFTESATGEFYKDFRFRDQIRAASGSIMDNIAEGFERSSRLEFINFLSFAKGSCGEVKSQLHRAKNQQYITEDFFTELYESYDKLSANIAGFIGYLNRTSIKGQKFKDRN